MLNVAAYTALAMAGCLLGLQIVLGLEATAGGSLGTQASMILAMVTLAALPVFMEAARKVRAWGLVVALGIAFIAFLAYSLPATTGRTGEIKQSKVADAAAVARVRDDLQRTTVTLEWARKDMIEDCGSGEGKRCRAKRNTVQALDDRAGKLRNELAAGEKAAPGDLGAEAWAWASFGTVTAETVRRGGVIAFALGLDVAIWSLIWLATSILARPVAAVAMISKVSAPPEIVQRRPESLDDHELAALRRAFAAGDGPLTNKELADLMGVAPGEASKRVTKAIDLGVLSRQRVGKSVAVSMLN